MLEKLAKFLETTTNELIALTVVLAAVLISAYVTVTTGNMVFLNEAGLIIIGYFFGRQSWHGDEK